MKTTKIRDMFTVVNLKIDPDSSIILTELLLN